MGSDGVDHIRRILDRLVQERQQLRHEPDSGAALEANRLALVYWQQQLQRVLLAERPPAA
jgi:hypothetical protein